MNINIANRLAALRRKQNLSQEELAEKIGVSRQAISKWERGESAPDTDNLITLAKLYGITIDNLLYDPGNENTAATETVKEEELFSETDAQENVEQSKFTSRLLLEMPLGVLMALIYIVLGLFFNAWDWAWIVFLTIPILRAVVFAAYPNAARNYRENKAHKHRNE